jgi:hypothetical protein
VIEASPPIAPPVAPPAAAPEPPRAESTLELGAANGANVARVAAQLEDLDDFPEATMPLVDAFRPSSGAVAAPAPLPAAGSLARPRTPVPAAGSLARPRTPVAAWAPSSPPFVAASPGVVADGRSHRPSSIAPLAVDVAGPHPNAHAMHMPPPRPSRSNGPLIGALVGAGVLAIAALVAAPVLTRLAFSSDEAPLAAVSSPSPRTAETVGVPHAEIDKAPATATQKAAGGDRIAEDDVPTASISSLASVPVSAPPSKDSRREPAPEAPPTGSPPARSATSPQTTTPGSKPAPSPAASAATPPPEAPAAAPEPPRPAPPPAAPRPVATTGTLQVSPTLRAVQVDGSYRRVKDGVVVLPCGPHKVQAGVSAPRVVDVPCGGSVAF